MTFSEELTKVGVTLTPEEIKSVKTALATPVIAPGGVWPELARELLKERGHYRDSRHYR